MFDITEMKKAANEALQQGRIRQNTADIYVNCLIRLNDGINKPLPSSELAEAILRIGGRSADSFVDAVSFYERKVLGRRGALLFPKDRQSIRINHQVRELTIKPITYRTKINKAGKYRLPFALQERSGLRIAEIANLTPNDIMIQDEQILLNVRRGKGGKQRFVRVLPSEYLLRELPEFEQMPPYSTLRGAANKMGFSTHDLRKVNARTRYWKAREEGMKKREALKVVQKELGHEKSDETIHYLGVEWKKRKNDWNY